MECYINNKCKINGCKKLNTAIFDYFKNNTKIFYLRNKMTRS